MQMLGDFEDVLEALGGCVALGKLCGDQETAAICNWRKRTGLIPCKYYIEIVGELRERNLDAEVDLFTFFRGPHLRTMSMAA